MESKKTYKEAIAELAALTTVALDALEDEMTNSCQKINDLEAELSKARAGVEIAKGYAQQCYDHMKDAQAERDAAQNAAFEMQKLIEQMREALFKLVGTLEVMSVMPETLGKYPVLAMDAPELEQARAALSAAERGE